MEQAYSLFAQQYGQYGDGSVRYDDRYNEINGGFSCYCLHLFYGDDADDGQRLNTAVTGDGKVVLEGNRAVIQQLLALSKAQGGDAPVDVHIMGWTCEQDAVNRLLGTSYGMWQTVNNAVTANPDDASLNAALNALFQINYFASQYRDQLPQGQHREGETSMDITQIRSIIDYWSVQLKMPPFNSLILYHISC